MGIAQGKRNKIGNKKLSICLFTIFLKSSTIQALNKWSSRKIQINNVRDHSTKYTLKWGSFGENAWTKFV